VADPVKPGPNVRLRYSKPSTMDDGRPCQVYCDEADATVCIVELVGHYREWRFDRSKGDPTRWEGARDDLVYALQNAFDQGRNHQRHAIASTLREVIGL